MPDTVAKQENFSGKGHGTWGDVGGSGVWVEGLSHLEQTRVSGWRSIISS